MSQIGQLRDKGRVVLTGLLILILGIYLLRYGTLGSDVDWMSQHTVFPDYFRRLFYETGNLLPNFAANIGGGQNIYDFSYYGFLNPVILISYLLPHVKMPAYIMATSILSLAAACLIFYQWLKGKGFSEFITVSVSIIFVLSSPLLYHTYKQIIFVNYLPFLCLAFIGVDRYFNTGKRSFLTVSIFFLIMSSYYFSVSGLLAIILYGVSIYLEKTDIFDFSDFLKNGLLFLLPVFAAIFMAGILLVPTFAALLDSHRGGGQAAVSVYSLFVPEFKLLRYVYYPYGIGLPTIVITALAAGLFYQKRSERILAYGLLLLTVFPVFLYVLNGGLYAEEKVLIPFLPIICYLIALFLQKIERKESRLQKKLQYLFPATIFLAFISFGQTVYWYLALADAVLMFLCYLIYRKRDTVKLFVIPAIIILLITDFAVQNPEKLIQKEKYREIFDPNIVKVMEEVNYTDSSYYRMDSFLNMAHGFNRTYTERQYLTSFYSSSYQKDYFNFRNDIFSLEHPYRNYLMQSASQNPLFLKFMGVKYVLSNYAPIGFKAFLKKSSTEIYRNQDVFPLGYVTDRLISVEELYKAEFPYRQELLLHRAVIEKPVEQDAAYRSKITPIMLRLPVQNESWFTISTKGDTYRINAQKEAWRYISLPHPAAEDQIVFLEMKVRNLTPLQDISVTIQNEQNKLTSEEQDYNYNNKNNVFHYAVSVRKGSKFLMVKFSPGVYEISSLKSYALNAADMKDTTFTASHFEVSEKDTKGDVIAGTVDAKVNGYFITSIPYDKGFNVTVDGKNVSYEKVNTAFIGFPIAKGVHQIIFRYESPGYYPGIVSSIIGFLILGILILRDQKNWAN